MRISGNKARFGRVVAALMILLMVLALPGCKEIIYVTGNAAPIDWSGYLDLTKEIERELDPARRELLMHRAEDMLMDTGAVAPIYYVRDCFLLRPEVQNLAANVTGVKYFAKASYPGQDVLKASFGPEPDSIDPALTWTFEGTSIASSLFEGLLVSDERGNHIPALANDLPAVSPDGATYTFVLREGLSWSDGRPLTGWDFVYAWNRAVALDEESFLNVIAKNEDGSLDLAVSEDGRVLTVFLGGPCAYFSDLCSMPMTMPLRQDIVEGAPHIENPDFDDPGVWATEAGFPVCGPYKLTSWVHDSNMVLEKNEYYHGAAGVIIPRIELMITADTGNMLAAYNAGSLDFCSEIPPEVYPVLRGMADFKSADIIGVSYAMFNVESRMFDYRSVEDARDIRMALRLLIDRQRIVDSCVQSEGAVANTFVPESMNGAEGILFKRDIPGEDGYQYPYHGEDGGVGFFPTEYSEDAVAEAIYLLERAGFQFEEKNGRQKLSKKTPLSFEFLINDSTANVDIAECIQQDFSEIGINMSIRKCSWPTFMKEVMDGHYDMARSVWIADFNDPVNMLDIFSKKNPSQLGERLAEQLED